MSNNEQKLVPHNEDEIISKISTMVEEIKVHLKSENGLFLVEDIGKIEGLQMVYDIPEILDDLHTKLIIRLMYLTMKRDNPENEDGEST